MEKENEFKNMNARLRVFSLSNVFETPKTAVLGFLNFHTVQI